jgi:uncharacterized protein with gpF-like domain
MNHGKWVWQARVAYRGRRKAALRESREAAREAESDLLRDLKAEATQEEQEGQRPATLRQLLEFYVDDLAARRQVPRDGLDGGRNGPRRRVTYARTARQTGDANRRGRHLRLPPSPS